jgi:hypothetical protein
LVQLGESLPAVAALVVGEGAQHADLDQAAWPMRFGGGVEPVEQREGFVERLVARGRRVPGPWRRTNGAGSR